jgi:hypothetical protein
MNYYVTLFTDGSTVECLGTCEADAGSRALRIRDQQRGDRLAVVEKIWHSFNR